MNVHMSMLIYMNAYTHTHMHTRGLKGTSQTAWTCCSLVCYRESLAQAERREQLDSVRPDRVNRKDMRCHT